MLKEIIIALQAYGEAHRFISKNKLWKWILIPGLIYCLLFLFGFYYFWTSSGSAIDYMLLKSGARAWLDRMEDEWFRFFFIVANLILMFLLMLFYFSLFKYIFLIVGSPLFAYLSEKTESILEGREFPFSLTQLIKDALRGIRIAGRNIFWQTFYTAIIIVASLIPVMGWMSPLLLLFLESYYLGFSMIDYSCERKNIKASESIEYINKHKGLAIGNGIVFYMIHLLPVVGWVLAPSYAVVAATISFSNARKQNIIS